MTTTMEKSKNFRIDALLAHDLEQRTDSDGASPGLYYSRSPGGSPVSNRGSETPSPHPNPTNSTSVQPGLLSKSHLVNLSQSGFTALHQGGLLGMHPSSMYPLTALGGQHHAFMYPGFTQLMQPYPEQLKGATMAATLPLEHWIRAGMMIPRVGEYGGEWIFLLPVVTNFNIRTSYNLRSECVDQSLNYPYDSRCLFF